MVQISDDELISELQRCYDNEGSVDGPTLNNTDNEYPTQPTYSYRFDGGLREACEIANIPYGSKESWDRESIIKAGEDYFDENGTLFVSDFDKSNKLPPTSVMYDHFESIHNLVEETSFTEEIREQKRENRKIANERNAESSRKYELSDTDALEDHLWWILKEYGDTKTDTVNDAPGPSVNVYRRIYGSIVEARKEAGMDSFSYRENFEDRIGALPKSYDENADGYIYVLKIVRDGEEYYYVGMSTRLKKRLNKHSLGKSKVMLHHENKYATMEQLNLYPVCVVRIENYYKNDGEDDADFRDRLKSKEHIVSHQISAAFNTDKILGGRS
jgi:hypothetical protein